MDVEERERLARIGLRIVLGDGAGEVRVELGNGGAIVVRDARHSFGFPVDLSESSVAWAKRLPECPRHPDSHAMTLVITSAAVTASCPISVERIRSADY